MASGWVPGAPFRERFEQSEITLAQLADRLGYVRDRHGHPNTPAVKRMLNRENVTYRNAERLMDALGLDPFEAGL